jgi:hypothetical protein
MTNEIVASGRARRRRRRHKRVYVDYYLNTWEAAQKGYLFRLWEDKLPPVNRLHEMFDASEVKNWHRHQPDLTKLPDLTRHDRWLVAISPGAFAQAERAVQSGESPTVPAKSVFVFEPPLNVYQPYTKALADDAFSQSSDAREVVTR